VRRTLTLVACLLAALAAAGPAGASLRPLQWSLDAIGIDRAWAETLGDPSVVIAIVDTGIDYTNPAFAGRVVLGPDLADGDDDPMDTYGHGTAVAALAAASPESGGIAGVCPRCTLLAVKVARDGSGEITKAASAAGIIWAADHGADVINLSFGGPDPDPAQRAAVEYAWQHGVVVVASAGNGGTRARQYPAAYDHVVSVAASDRNDRPAALSSFGGWVDLVAPGVTLLAPSLLGGSQPWTGTSFATPLVAGVAGLVRTLLPGATTDQVVTALLAGTVPLRPRLFGHERRFARGRVDLPMLLEKLPFVGRPTLTITRLAVPLAREGTQFTVRADVLRDDLGRPLARGTVRCAARLAGRGLRVAAAVLVNGAARCTWRLPAGSRKKTVRGTIRISADGFAVAHEFTALVYRR